LGDRSAADRERVWTRETQMNRTDEEALR